MMTKPILEIQQISKKFEINRHSQPYLSLRDSMTNLFSKRHQKEDFMALQDVSFDVQEGDTIGIIGKNGAGKSTLLKILSRITPPSSGKIISRGRIASLLEVGTGFHPELTGKENIFMNGSILGMRKKEILRNFDAIVDFAGVERFIETPLKHYSSGMQLRLAFAVAAFLENEILIIDEVLAVGDAEFQKKCMNKMGDISQSGRTILFVSHNMGAIRQLCKQGIYLKSGTVAAAGSVSDVIHIYSESGDNNTYENGFLQNPGKLVQAVTLSCDDEPTNTVYTGCSFRVAVQFSGTEVFDYPVLGIIIRDQYGEPIIGINNKHYNSINLVKESITKGELEMHIPFLPISTGHYTIDVHLGNGYFDLEVLKNIRSFQVTKSGIAQALEVPDDLYNRILIDKVNWKYNHGIQ